MLRLVDRDDPILKTPVPAHDFAAEVDFDRQQLGADMARIMVERRGIGLAAPQVGLAVRMFVMRSGSTWGALWNPKIVRRRGLQRGPEGCLSFPGLILEVARPLLIEVTWLDWRGAQMGGILDGIGARCFAHELDHLNGVLFKDHAKDAAEKRENESTADGMKRELAMRGGGARR